MSFFKSAVDRMKDCDQFLANMGKPLSYGVNFLDHATGGLFPDDLVLVLARTGEGKTELAAQIAQTNAQAGKTVCFFALEAHTIEIELRIKYKMLAQAYFICTPDWRTRPLMPNYQDWIQGALGDMFAKFNPEVIEEFNKRFQTLLTFYRDKEFNIKTFETQMSMIGERADVVIVDHLHYFDMESENENREMKKILKQIKDIVSFYRKPVVLVVHARKADKRMKSILPSMDDIHGSSDIGKIATRVVATAPAYDRQSYIKFQLPTYFKLLKNRYDGSRCRKVGISMFDFQQNIYSQNYLVGDLKNEETEVIELDRMDYPHWARHAQSGI